MSELQAGAVPEDDGDVETVEDEGTGSLLDQLRARRAEIEQGDFHKDVAVPGYNDLLWVRFRPHPINASTRKSMAMRKRIQANDEGVILDSSCDALIEACDQLYLLPTKFRGDPGPEGVNLVKIDDEVPVKFDMRLAELLSLGVPPPPQGSARMVVKKLFPTEQGIVILANEVNEWLRDVTKEADESFLGE